MKLQCPQAWSATSLQQPRFSSLYSIRRVAPDRLEAGHGGGAGTPSAVCSNATAEEESLFPQTQAGFRNLGASTDGGRRRRHRRRHRARHGDARRLDQQRGRRRRRLRGWRLLLLRGALPAARGLCVRIGAAAADRLSQPVPVFSQREGQLEPPARRRRMGRRRVAWRLDPTR